MADTMYDVTVDAALPAGPDILNKPCTVTFTYQNGSLSHPYNGKIKERRNATVVRMSSATMNIDDAWTPPDRNGGILNINGAVERAITGFVKIG